MFLLSKTKHAVNVDEAVLMHDNTMARVTNGFVILIKTSIQRGKLTITLQHVHLIASF